MLAFEGRWVYRRTWKRRYNWNEQYITDYEHLRQDIPQPLDWKGAAGLVQFKLTYWEFWEGKICGIHVEWYPLNEEDWLADDWEEFKYWEEES